MRIITCAGYYATGSSAVTDFFSEFSNCSSVGGYEFRFAHDPDGIRDLEYNLIDNNNRHNTSNAIKRFIRYVTYLNGGRLKLRKCYRKFLDDEFLKYSMEYLHNITELQTAAWWHYDQQEKGMLFDFVDKGLSKIVNFLHIRKFRFSLMEIFKEQAYFSAIDKETFYNYTREYTEKIVNYMNKSKSDFVMVDQLVPPSNVNRYLNYFNDIKVIVVDRDPRDIFISANEIYKEKIIPYSKVDEFCKWYEITRRHRKHENYDSEKVLFLKFEDMLYDYENTTKRLVDFIGLDAKDHVHPKMHFIPEISINNTNLKRKYPKYKEDIKFIEEHLKEYLYDFPAKDQT